MEALSAGSSAVFKAAPAQESQYQPLLPVAPVSVDEMHSYTRISRSEHHYHAHDARKELKSLYEDPDSPIIVHAQIPSQLGQPAVTKDKSLSYLERPTSPVKIRCARSRSPAKVQSATAESVMPGNQATVSPSHSPLQGVNMTISDDKESYNVVDAMAGIESIDAYEDMTQSNPLLQAGAKSPRRSITVPMELSKLAEMSAENLSIMNPNEAQLWLLNQMQKLVEKFAGAYHESTAAGYLPKSNKGKLLPAQEGEETYEDATSVPPIPPRTYSCTVQKTQYQMEESDASGRKISRQSKSVRHVDAGTKSPAATGKSPYHQAKAVHHDQPLLKPQPPSSSKSDMILGRSIIKFIIIYVIPEVGKGSPSIPVVIKQKRDVSHTEMISKCGHASVIIIAIYIVLVNNSH